jgi:PHD/YefM family antitoxin component YafN of YafNO toxin-antitoxin module
VTINTKEGNVVMLSEDDYRSLIESLTLAGIPGLYESIIEGVNTPLSKTKKLKWK